MTRPLPLAAAAILLAVAGPARAQVLTFQLTNTSGNVPPGNAVTVAPNGSFTYRAYLVANAAAQTLVASHGNLVSVTMTVTQSNTALAPSSTPAANTAVWNLGTTTGSTATTPVINDAVFPLVGVAPSAFGSSGAIGWLLGTVAFNAGTTTGSDTLTIKLKDTLGSDIVAQDGTFFDTIAQSSTTTFTVSPVPEPGALALAGLAAAGLAAVRRWRAKAQ